MNTRSGPPGGLGAWLTVGGFIGLLASTVLLIEKIALIEDPDYVPTCSLNPILSCGSVMETPQAEVFGFANPILGIAGFAIVTTVGVALLAGATFARWFWGAFQVGVTLGVVFVHWLVYQSLYVIGALCPYCMVVWVVTIAVFVVTTVRTLQHRSSAGSRPIARTATEYRGVILTVWYLVIAALIAQRFMDYWVTLV